MVPQPPTKRSWQEASEDTLSTVQEAQRQLAKATELLNPNFNPNLSTIRKMLGIGRRVIVPPDQIHAVRGNGPTVYMDLPKQTTIFGFGDAGSVYWYNSLTKVIVLVTKSFQVPIINISAMDCERVSFSIDAYAIAALDPNAAVKAAEKIGDDPQGLVTLVREVTSSELLNAAAKMRLEEILEDRSRLVDAATAPIVKALTDLGYNLDVLRITGIRGEAVSRWQTRALAEVSKEATIKTNVAQLAETEDIAKRDQREAEIGASKQRIVAEKDREARQAIAIGEHDFKLEEYNRDLQAAERANQISLQKVNLAQQVELAEVEKQAALQREQLQLEADLRAEQQKRLAMIALAEQQAADDKAKLAQLNLLAREAERAEADAQRLEKEERARAEREREVRRIEAEAEAQALKIQAMAIAEEERTRATAQADAAEQEAKAATSRATARIKDAEATRAQTAAQGLAEAEVAARKAEVALKQAEAEKAQGLARAEVAAREAEVAAERERQMRQVEIDAQATLAQVYAQNPVLVELEQVRMRQLHEQKLAEIRINGQIALMSALASQLDIRAHLIGNGGQMGNILAQILALTSGYEFLSNESPTLNSLLSRNGHHENGIHANGNEANPILPSLMAGLSSVLGKISQDVNPRMLASLTIADVVERAAPLLEGESDVATFLKGLKNDTNFNVIANIPVGRLLASLVKDETQETPAVTELPVA